MSVEVPVKRIRLVRFDVLAMTNTVCWDGQFVDCDSEVGNWSEERRILVLFPVGSKV